MRSFNVLKPLPGDTEASLDHSPHQLFSELEELYQDTEGSYEWKETARWVKFEEDVEEGSNRWSKPHVSSLSMHSLIELRSLILKGTVFLDLEGGNLNEILDVLLEKIVHNGGGGGGLTFEKIEPTKAVIMKKHRHQFEGRKKMKSETNLSSRASSSTLSRMISFDHGHPAGPGLSGEESLSEVNNAHFRKKLPRDAEAANILVGVVDFLDSPLCALVRLKDSVDLGDLTEVSLPTRFLFILLGPESAVQSYHEIGRSMASSLADEVLHEVAYKAKNKKQIVAGLDEFLDQVTVLPPGEWDRSVRIEPPVDLPNQDNRKQSLALTLQTNIDEEEEEDGLRREAGLVRSGRLFGGLINDFNRKRVFYWQDFTEALHLQSLASVIFIYFAALAPTVAFGGLLGDATENRMASIECLVAGLTAGVLFGLLSGQPLTILGVTGPDLVFETIVFDFCKNAGWDYLSFRVWIGWWIALILILIVAFDVSAFVCYITRFTEECFATLIAVIFIVKAFEKVANIAYQFPLEPDDRNCPGLGERPESNSTLKLEQPLPCSSHNVFLMSLLLFFGTYFLATFLKKFKNERFFPAVIRNYISNFSVIIAIFLMVVMDFLLEVRTPKLSVPSELTPTWSGRGWVIPLFNGNPWYTALLALLPALLGSILIFMDQQITAVIVNRKEHMLRKGPGYHLDLLVLSLIIIINSYLGIPWYVASTILSINHVRSLQVESDCAAPGEKIKENFRKKNRFNLFIYLFFG